MTTNSKQTDDQGVQPETLIEFPCEFQLKVMGYNRDNFAQKMHEITQKFVKQTITPEKILVRPSRTKKFLSVNISFTADSKQQLDAIYQALTEHELVTMAL